MQDSLKRVVDAVEGMGKKGGAAKKARKGKESGVQEVAPPYGDDDGKGGVAE